MEKSITIRHVPDATCAELAARGGRSLQEYLLLQLVEIAGSPDADTVVAGMRARKDATGTTMSPDRIVRLRDLERR